MQLGLGQLFIDYFQEREELSLLASEMGFASYKIERNICYIKDIYVVPEERKNGYASVMADQITKIAKENGCEFLVGSVCPAANKATESLQILLAYGFKLFKCENNMIYFRKEI